MATSPYFLWPAQQASSATATAASDVSAGFGFGAAQGETASTDMGPLVAPELSEAVGRPRLRRQSSGSGSGRGPQQQASGSGGAAAPKKPPQRGLGVAELERLRCGGFDPLQDLNAVAAAAAAMADAVNASVLQQGNSNSVLLQHPDHLPPPFDVAPSIGSRYYSPLLVQPSPAPPAPPAPVRYVHSHSAPGVAAEQQYFMDRWGRMGGFVPVGNGGQQLQMDLPAAAAAEHPSSQNTIWRPAASSSAPCFHTGHRCDLCSKTMRALTERGSRAPAAAATAMPDYSIYDLAAAMTSAGRKETTGEGFLARLEGKKEVREIEFFPTSTNHGAAGDVGPDDSEFSTMRWAPFSSSSSAGGHAAPLDLSLRL
ncbi:uncharacterized protein LOC112270712 [Brachypodium distachyon]|uniref:uncharacterized protein LOC112270712 n=1 Tax=Brachypodium distachyon TaxID=15368 RepID=UPI0001C71DF1|nr:uncharacterized protein LOC112270712 [Brachypodium distachyon]|eukprot:XP_024314533.1 uncharacterized protein LOC112270712 [Brachypodium distachyon]